MRILITGGAGFVGSHAAEYFGARRDEVIVFDNLSRAQLLNKDSKNAAYNWNYLKQHEGIKLINGDITDFTQVRDAFKDIDVVIHTAAQTAVTTSLLDPKTDFMVNALGTLNVLEATRRNNNDATVICCSTNKVYGDNVNRVNVHEKEKRYEFVEYEKGIPETFPIDHCEHTPYGCSKLAADIYVQDYAKIYGLHTAVFRMSCIYGPRQFGVEDQGWVAWFIIAAITGKKITIYGDGKQVRDILYISDLITAFDKFVKQKKKLSGQVFNMGGGSENTISLIELLDLLKEITGKRSRIQYKDWRPSDQKVYISDTRKAKKKLQWTAEVSPKEGIGRLTEWVMANKQIF